MLSSFLPLPSFLGAGRLVSPGDAVANCSGAADIVGIREGHIPGPFWRWNFGLTLKCDRNPLNYCIRSLRSGQFTNNVKHWPGSICESKVEPSMKLMLILAISWTGHDDDDADDYGNGGGDGDADDDDGEKQERHPRKKTKRKTFFKQITTFSSEAKARVILTWPCCHYQISCMHRIKAIPRIFDIWAMCICARPGNIRCFARHFTTNECAHNLHFPLAWTQLDHWTHALRPTRRQASWMNPFSLAVHASASQRSSWTLDTNLSSFAEIPVFCLPLFIP